MIKLMGRLYNKLIIFRLGTSKQYIATVNCLHAVNIRNICPYFLFTLSMGKFFRIESALLLPSLPQSRPKGQGHPRLESQNLAKRK